MFVIENGFTYIAFLMFLCGGLLALQKYAKWKIFNIVPPLVWIYLIGMACCTAGMFNSEGVDAAYGALTPSESNMPAVQQAMPIR